MRDAMRKRRINSHGDFSFDYNAYKATTRDPTGTSLRTAVSGPGLAVGGAGAFTLPIDMRIREAGSKGPSSVRAELPSRRLRSWNER